ncbi:MAG: trehalose-6-phosphate synthase [Deltaproteobacteria bacterium]|nr:trehalose-6-phosphate synthase [Deltaproteobacteria bacterium]
MRRALRFVIALVVGLAMLAGIASVIVQNTARTWFEKDIVLRSQLVLNGARREAVSILKQDDRAALRELLVEITQDERIIAAAACSKDGQPLAATDDYPTNLACADIVKSYIEGDSSFGKPWTAIRDVLGVDVHVTALPVTLGDDLGAVVTLLHDMSFIERREAKTRYFLFGTFALLAFCAAVVTMLAARLSWRSWNQEISRLLNGVLGGKDREEASPEFQPLLKHVREFAARIAEQEGEGDGRWTNERLKQTLRKHLEGEKVIIVANREPYIHEMKDGKVTVLHPASGLVTALEPVMRACSGVWVAHGSGSADRQTADRQARLRVPPGEESYWLRRVWLSKEEETGYYYGFSNEGLWPLCHVAHARPTFRSSDWKQYVTVNKKFAETVCQEADSDEPIVLVQDYHFALAPQMIRERLPRATILSFWHIPWPNAERFGICPWRDEVLQGMLGSSIVGFHTQQHCNNFIDSVDHYLEARIDRERFAVVQQRQQTMIKPYPISIEWPNHWVKSAAPPADCKAAVFAELGLKPNALLGVGVDRLDYTKGVEERLSSVERLLERFPSFRGRFSFVQLAAPSRTVIDLYRELNENVEKLAARINERFGHGDYRPIILLRAHHEPPTVFRYYRAADVCYVSSLHDGMNLVAKEFVAAREDERGVLVLSHFTGAARELTEALIVNPYDLDEASSALASALMMPPQEQQDRMRSMRAIVSEFNVYRWAGRMLIDAARLRRRHRLTGRLSERITSEEIAS